MGFVGAQRDGELMFLFEGILGLHRIRRDAKDADTAAVELRAQGRKCRCLPGAAGGIRLGIEKQNELAALEVGQRYLVTAVARQCERGSRGSGGQFHGHMPSFRRFQRAKVSRDITRAGPRRSSDLHERARLWRTSAPAGHNLKKQSA